MIKSANPWPTTPKPTSERRTSFISCFLPQKPWLSIFFFVYLLTSNKFPYNLTYAAISALIKRGGGKRPDETRQPTCNVAGRVPIPAEQSARWGEKQRSYTPEMQGFFIACVLERLWWGRVIEKDGYRELVVMRCQHRTCDENDLWVASWTPHVGL